MLFMHKKHTEKRLMKTHQVTVWNAALSPTAFSVTRRASSATSYSSASKTTASAAPTGWWAWPWSSWGTSRGRAAAPAGARWASESTWTTRASPPCGSSPSAPTTMCPRSLWGWSRRRGRPRRADEDGAWRRISCDSFLVASRLLFTDSPIYRAVVQHTVFLNPFPIFRAGRWTEAPPTLPQSQLSDRVWCLKLWTCL